MALAIESALRSAGGGFIEKYRLMKNRLLTNEYEHWAAGFPEGNNHGRGHITRVLEYLNHLVGPKPLAHLDVYELFLAMMSILYHDIGLLRQRKGHADISKQLLEDDANDRYIINLIDKEIIAAAVVSHSSSKDIRTECSRFSEEEIIGPHRARPTVIASLVRLSDELDEDYRRADPILEERLNLPEESHFFWLFCQRVRGVRPVLVRKQININLKFEANDPYAIGPLPGGKQRRFISFAAEKLAKINHERTALNKFLPPELQYSGLHVDVKPLPSHPTWSKPRTFVFNDSTTAEMFLGSYPELHTDAANAEMQKILDMMKEGNLAGAESTLENLQSVLADLPRNLRHRVYYEKACVHSLKAAQLTAGSEQTHQLDTGLSNLLEWHRLGEQSAFREEGRTASAEVDRMSRDGDLAFVISQRLTELKTKLPTLTWPTQSGPVSTSQCILFGSHIDTPDGARKVESIRYGDEVFSIRRSAEGITRVKSRVTGVAASRSARFVRLNDNWEATTTQPVLTRKGWLEVGLVELGQQVMNADGRFVVVTALEIVPSYVEVFDLVVSCPEHNFIANGLVCHNKTPWDSAPIGGVDDGDTAYFP